jgi:hypothetical protein
VRTAFERAHDVNPNERARDMLRRRTLRGSIVVALGPLVYACVGQVGGADVLEDALRRRQDGGVAVVDGVAPTDGAVGLDEGSSDARVVADATAPFDAATPDAASPDATPLRDVSTLDVGPTVDGGVPRPCVGTCYHVRPAASGDGSGRDWANACGGFAGACAPRTLRRGATYYVASGAYGAYRFDAPASGTTTITITKATALEHGTEAGWSSDLGVGQARFAGGASVAFATSDWVFDGAVGRGADPNSYGFYFTPSASGTSIRPVVYDGDRVTIRHTAVTCPGPAGDIQQFGFSGTGARVTADFTYANNCQVSHWNQGDDNVISNSYMGTYWSSSANHGVHVEQVLRPSFFNNVVTSCAIQCIEPGGGATTNINDGRYYNNVFVNVSGTNGVWKGTSSGAIIDTLIYGNTFVNVTGPILYQNNAGLGRGAGNVMTNNLLYRCNALYEQAGGGAIAHAYNALFDSGTIAETGVQIATGDPFVDAARGDYRLRSATAPGQALPAPYDRDADGVVRGADGAWDRGAYERR